jgi:hypothetical protein
LNAAVRLERSVPLWGVLTALCTLIATGAGVVWNLAGIAHDVADMKGTVMEVRTDVKGQTERLYALEGRVVKLESSVQFMEGKSHG